MEHDEKKGYKGKCRCEDCLEELRYLMAEFYVEMGLPIPKTIKV